MSQKLFEKCHVVFLTTYKKFKKIFGLQNYFKKTKLFSARFNRFWQWSEKNLRGNIN